jgi:type I restriction enzyme, R subunit
MLLTGFDAPNLWTLFLYKPLKEHRLLQAVARTNRPFVETKEFGLVVDYVGVADNLEGALKQFEGDFKNEVLLIWRGIEYSEKEFENLIGEVKNILGRIRLQSLQDIDAAVQSLVLNKKEQEFLKKVRKLRALFESLFPSETTLKHLEYYKWLISTSVALRKYRVGDGMRLAEIERMAKKTYLLIQNTIGVDNVRKIGEVDLSTKLEEGSEPIQALREVAEVQETEQKNGGGTTDFYRTLTGQVEQIVEEMRENRTVTKELVQRIKHLQENVREREEERKRLGEAFPIFDVFRIHFKDATKSDKVSKEIIEELRNKELLNKEAFLIGRYRREIKGRIREDIIKNFGLVDSIDEIEEKAFTNLEHEYEKEEEE